MFSLVCPNDRIILFEKCEWHFPLCRAESIAEVDTKADSWVQNYIDFLPKNLLKFYFAIWFFFNIPFLEFFLSLFRYLVWLLAIFRQYFDFCQKYDVFCEKFSKHLFLHKILIFGRNSDFFFKWWFSGINYFLTRTDCVVVIFCQLLFNW